MKFEKFLIPKGEEIIAKRIQNFVTDFTEFDYKEASDIKPLNEWIFPLMQMEKEELVARIMAKELSKLDTNYTAHSDLNVDETSRSRSSDRGSDRGDRGDRRGSDRGERRGSDRGERGMERGSRRDKFSDGEPTTRLFINLGKKDNLRYDEMREMIFQNTKVSGHHIKDIEMQGVFSFFETDAQSAERILTGFNNVEVNGREVRISRAEGNQNEGGRSAERSERKGPRERTYPSARVGGSSSGGDRKYGSSSRGSSTGSSSRGGSSSSTASKPRYKKRNDDTSW